MPYPSTLSVYSDPLASERLNSPSHSSIESAQNTGLKEIQAFVGTLSSLAGTLIYDIRATDSDGGGHVQGVNKGGTNQTGYTKGDILVATSSSVLARLGVGANNLVPIADTSQSSGIRWGSPNRLGTVASVVTVIGNTNETSILSVTIPASILSTNNAVRATAYISAYTVGGPSDTLLIRANYGNNSIGSVLLAPVAASTPSVGGKIELTVLANAASDVQRSELLVDLRRDMLSINSTSIIGVNAFRSTISSINSMANQTLGLTAQWGASIAGSRFDVDGYIVEKII